MSRDVAEYDGIKYSLQPHGLKSRLISAFAFFVVAFGGALALASPAQADPTDPLGKCYVAVAMSPQPTSPSPSPATTPSPTACSTVTVPGPTVTVIKTKTVYLTKTETQTVTVTVTPLPPPTKTADPTLTTTPDPSFSTTASGSGDSSLASWGVGVVGVAGLTLLGIGVYGLTRRRRYQGAHQADNSETTMIPAVRSDEYSVSDYDPNLGGHAGESYRGEPFPDETAVLPAVKDDGTDTKPMPKVE